MITRLLRRALCLLTLTCTASHLSSAEINLDAPGPEKGVTFSHVYKIDIPGSSSCKLESGVSQGQASDLHTELQSTPAENDIVFRHNIRLQPSTCDCEESESFKSLLYRVNGLEEEVNYLKTQCVQGCCGKGGSAEDCNDNGRCVDGKCVCHQGYTGNDCSQLMCPDNCNDKGHCVDGKCICFSHFTGDDCSVQKCPNDCVGTGRCVDGQCICDDGFYGDDCSLVLSPKGLQLVHVTDISLLVQWESVHGAEYYILTYHPKNDRSAMEQVRVHNTENSYLITGLTPGVTYSVDVHAVIKGIQSDSDNIEATTDVSGVDDIQVLGQTEDSIQVDWKNPTVVVDRFKLTHSDPTGQEAEQSVQKSQEARTKHTIVGLLPGTEYHISVQAIKGTAEGKVSSVTGVTDLDAPTNLATIEVTEDTARVSWDRVQAEIQSYMLSYTYNEGSSGEIPVGRDSASYRFVGLKPGVLYTVYLWTIKGHKESQKSSTEAETEMDAPTNLLASDETESSFSVSWDKVQAEIDGYLLSYSSTEGSRTDIPVGSESASYRLMGLKPGVLYTVYVWAVRGDKTSKKVSTQAETELDSSSNLLASEETDSSFSVSWDRAKAEIDSYILSYNSAEGSGEIPVGPDNATYRLTGLRPGVVYTVYIWAVRGDKTSKKISTQAETDIDAPKDLKATDVKMQTASLAWIRPLADIEGYILTYRAEDGSMETVERQLGAGESLFALSGLDMGKRYVVTLTAHRGAKRSKTVELIFKTVGLLHPFPMDCVQILRNGNTKSGLYTIYINNDRTKAVEVYCDMDTDSGGWLMLQRRTSGKLDFMKRWRQYIAGFGNMTDEFWLGLEKIYDLTNTPTQYELRFDLGLGSERAYAVYDSFKIAPSKQKFKLTIGKYRGTAGDAMTYHQGRPWSTVDSDNDIALGNCALTHGGAWWYKNCHLANLNGKWGDNRHSMGVNWEPWKGHLISLDFTEMKIRPVGALSSRKRRSARERSKAAASNEM